MEVVIVCICSVIQSETQQEMQPTKIKKEVGCLGPHGRILEVGYEKNIAFQEVRNRPLWMTPQDRVAINLSKYDKP